MLGLAASTSLGQERGDVIHGTVSDEFGPLPGAHVMEINKDGRVTASGVTDVNGNFSFAIRSPQDKLKISFVGCETKIIPIKGTAYKIIMSAQQKSLKEITVTAQRKTVSSGLAIPETEMSIATQTISAKEFEGLPVTSIDEALQGRIASLDIVAASGNLGAGTSMRLRGVSTINGNAEPLIVVDGNVWETDANNGFDFSNATDEKFAELLSVNPDDIEAISVLKDAAATAIWGSQGANGVIEIKTKRGSRGKTRVSYSYRANMTYQPDGINLLTGGEYTMYLKEAYFNPSLSDDAAAIKEISGLHSDAQFSEWRMFDNNTDWREAVKQVGVEQKHYFSITGGGEKANFRVSAGYDHQTGSIIEQKLDRFTTRTALDFFISRSIKVTANFNFTYTNNQKNNEKQGSLLGIAQTKMPNLGIYEEDADGNSTGEYYHMKSTASPEFNNDQKKLPNPVALAHEAINNEKSFKIEPEFILSYDLLGTEADEQRLKYDGKVNFSIFNRFNDAFFPSSLVINNWTDKANNSAESSAHKSFAVTTTHTLTYQPVFTNRDHNVMAMARFQTTSGSSRSQNNSVFGLPTGIQSTSANGVIDGTGTGAGEWKSIYLTGSVHYSYKGRYSADFSVRHDGSTKFGKDSRWGTFPGISARWNISDESWMKWAKKYLSMLSIRPSWGIVGNQPGAEGLYFSKYVNAPSYMGNTSIAPQNIALNTLRWEKKEQWNLGFDLGFFGGKVTSDINLYKSTITDLLMPGYAIPSNSGFAKLETKNAGSMINVGWEFNVNTRGLLHWGKWNIDTNISFANNHNELVEMDPTILSNLNGEFDKNNGSYLSRVQLNSAFGSIYGFRYKGVYQYTTYSDVEVAGVSGPNAPVARNAAGEVVRDENGYTKPMYFEYGSPQEYIFKGGDAIYDDVNHDGTIDELDIVYLGSSLPKVTGGFGFTVTWGNFSWNNQFNFRAGNKIINKARMDLENMYNNNNQSRAVNWRWRVEGDVTSIPRALHNYGYNFLGSDRFVEDGSFLRLNYSSLNYTFDSKLLRPLGISTLKAFITAQNVFCLTKYSGADPEVNYGGYGVVTDGAKTPRAKSYSIGASITF